MTDFSDMGLTTLSIRTALLGWQCSDYLQHINFWNLEAQRASNHWTDWIYFSGTESILPSCHSSRPSAGGETREGPATALVLELGPIDSATWHRTRS